MEPGCQTQRFSSGTGWVHSSIPPHQLFHFKPMARSIRKWPSLNALSSAVWWSIHSWCVDIFNKNSSQSQPVPADSSGQLQVFCRQVCSSLFLISSPSLLHQKIPSGEDFQSTSMAAFIIRGLRPAQNGSRWTASVFNGDQLTYIKLQHMRTCIVSGKPHHYKKKHQCTPPPFCTHSALCGTYFLDNNEKIL